ncbi:NADPH-dependent 7-cyano-7-deazaguanine reductase QueF [Sulfuriferula nivalis]|uniref:NADPH-dependent 7-cyano-7-deazaguanine reductase n=1 Tax=Sulfuriferula nivalis TaxID=2675298 RepID=A0A809S9U4_9PROT|nr:NADPH-dependent 7-cyano-7-deazaguanine reductase QueF [Sulfuriferula nivalis]BBP01523.1 NADPH-dependent 7-cyano-7-deazaguanine reductase [Sulfuriferula nivalis]
MTDTSLIGAPLGKPTCYQVNYDPSLLFAIPRQLKRDEIGVQGDLPFMGADIWNAYELSWLNSRGKPQVAIATFIVPADTPNIVESKSFKLYLNSYNQTRIESPDALVARLRADIGAVVGAPVQVRLTLPEDFGQMAMGELVGELLDRLDIEVDSYEPNPELLQVRTDTETVEQTYISHLLKSNCLVTGQPDWATVQIQYVGAPIEPEGLLRYLIGFRNHNEFHEQCVERIFVDIMRHCHPLKLSVYARYTRRGGLDINPWRTNFSVGGLPSNLRHARQ